jgi:GAF domain-containing protein
MNDLDQEVEELCELAACVCTAPAAVVRVRERDVLRTAWHGSPVFEHALEDTPCATVLELGRPLVIGDLESAHGGARWGELGGARAYLGVPVLRPGESPVGTICVLDTRPRRFTVTDVRGLSLLANQVAHSLTVREREREVDRTQLSLNTACAERERIEQRFHALVESSPLAIFALDAEARPLFVSDGCAELFGTTLADERYDQDGWIPALHEEDRERATREWEHAVRNRISLDTATESMTPSAMCASSWCGPPRCIRATAPSKAGWGPSTTSPRKWRPSVP